MEIWILPAALGLLTIINGVLVWRWSQLRRDYVETFAETLTSLVKEWNRLVFTINALVTTLPEAGNGDTGQLTASEDEAGEVMGMSPAKRALYDARKGR